MEVRYAENGKDAIARLKQSPAMGVVLMDLIMPVDSEQILSLFRVWLHRWAELQGEDLTPRGSPSSCGFSSRPGLFYFPSFFETKA